MVSPRVECLRRACDIYTYAFYKQFKNEDIDKHVDDSFYGAFAIPYTRTVYQALQEIKYLDDDDDTPCSQQLSDEFKNVNLEDMTQTGFMTASGSISKKGKEEVEKRVQVQLNLQNKVQNRLMMLENECLKAGIEPLTKQHIQGFLFADDNTYISNLNMLIDSELKRAEQIKAKQEQELRQKIEAESKVKEEVTPFDEPKASVTIKEEQKIEKVEVKVIPVDSDGKVMKTLSCSIRVPVEATDDQVINAVINMIKGDKFPIENIKVM